MTLRTLFTFLFLLAGVAAFAPSKAVFAPATATTTTSKTALQFGFLKELGLEKPSWLPDFGGAKEKPADEAETTEAEAESTEEASEEE